MDATIVENSLGNRRSTKINWKSLPGTYTSSCRFLSFSNSQVSESYACFQPEDLRGDQAVDGPIRASAQPTTVEIGSARGQAGYMPREKQSVMASARRMLCHHTSGCLTRLTAMPDVPKHMTHSQKTIAREWNATTSIALAG
jgi:hypothetical protein